MLTQSDLDQIRTAIREEVGNEAQSIKSEFSSELRLTRMGIQDEIDNLTNRIKDLGIRVTNNHKEVTKKIEEVLTVLDKQDMKLLKRVKYLEDNVSITA